MQWEVTFAPAAAMLPLASARRTNHVRPMQDADSQLAGKLLIAMPDMSDPRFSKTVVFMCAHSADGGMGLIINKPQKGLMLSALLEQMEIPAGTNLRDAQVHFGGPVDHQRGFVLHSNDYAVGDDTLIVDNTYRMTATLRVLEDIAAGRGPDVAMLALGYAGWGPGQLEYEIGKNGWLTCAPDDRIIFGSNNGAKWAGALDLMGIDPLLLSATAGHA